jgi:hypothetical protein
VRYATPRPLPSRTKVVKRRLRRGPLGFTGSEQAAGPAPIQASPRLVSHALVRMPSSR